MRRTAPRADRDKLSGKNGRLYLIETASELHCEQIQSRYNLVVYFGNNFFKETKIREIA